MTGRPLSRLWRRDPRIAAGGRCVVCDEPRPLVAVKNLDPFCSTGCCKAWHAPPARRRRARKPNEKEVT